MSRETMFCRVNSRPVWSVVVALMLLLGLSVAWAPAASAALIGNIWRAQSATEDSGWRSVTYGNGVFVAVANSGTNRVMTSPDAVTWTPRAAAEANYWNSVTYGNGVFVAVAEDGENRVMTSTDGVTWTARTAAEANSWRSVTYGNGVFVAVASDGSNRVMTSTNGVSWTARSAAAANPWQSVTYGNALFVAVGGAATGTNRVMTSPDGVSWTVRTAAAANAWVSVTYGNALFVATSSNGSNRVMTSPDAVTWTARTAAELNPWWSVTYGDGVFIAVAGGGANRVMRSTDGVTWSVRGAAESNAWNSVTYGNGVFVAVATTGTNRVMTSIATFVPSAPTGLVVTAGDGSASIAFTAGSDGGASITKYQYRVGSGSWTDAVGTTSPIIVTGLSNYQTNTVRLRAVNSVGNSPVSSPVSVIPRQAGPAVTAATPSGSTGIVVTFTLNPLPGTTVAYQSVVAYARGTNTVAGSCRTYARQATCFIGGLTRATNYDLRVTAHLPVVGKTWHNTTAEGSILQVSTLN